MHLANRLAVARQRESELLGRADNDCVAMVRENLFDRAVDAGEDIVKNRSTVSRMTDPVGSAISP